MYSTPSLKDKLCNDFMMELNQILPDLDVRIRQTIQSLFLQNSENPAQFNHCIEASIENAEVQETAKKTAEKYFKQKKRKNPFLSSMEQSSTEKRMRLEPKEKRKAENPLPGDGERSKRLRIEPSNFEGRTNSISEDLKLLAKSSDEAIIDVCMYWGDILVQKKVLSENLADISSEDLSFITSLLSNQTSRVAESAWHLLKNLLRAKEALKKFNDAKQFDTLILLIENYRRKIEQPDVSFPEFPLDCSTEHVQKVLISGYCSLIFCRMGDSTAIRDEIISQAIDFLMSIAKQSPDEMASEACALLCRIKVNWENLMPPSLNIETEIVPLLMKFSHSGDFATVQFSVSGLTHCYALSLPKQIHDEIWNRMAALLHHENEEIVHCTLGSLCGFINMPYVKTQAASLSEAIAALLLHDNCWVAEAASQVLSSLLTVEGFRDRFCKGEGIENLMLAIEKCALETELEISISENQAESHLAIRLQAIVVANIGCLSKLIELFTPEVAKKILDLMIKLTGIRSNIIIRQGACFLGEMSFSSKEQFQGVKIDVARMSCKNLLSLCSSNRDGGIIAAAIFSLNRMVGNADFHKACIAAGGIEKLQRLLTNPQANCLNATLQCLNKWMKAQSGKIEIDPTLFEMAMSFLLHRNEEIVASALSFLLQCIDDKEISDAMGICMLKNTLPLLESTHELLLERAYRLLGKLADPEKKLNQSAEATYASGLLQMLIGKYESNADDFASYKLQTIEGISFCFCNLMLMQVERGKPFEHLCLLSKLTRHTHAKIAEMAFWLIHKIGSRKSLKPQQYLDTIVQVCFVSTVDGLKHSNLKVVDGAAWCFGRLVLHPSAFGFNNGDTMKSAIDTLIGKLTTNNEKTPTLLMLMKCLGQALVNAPPTLNLCQYAAENHALPPLAGILKTTSNSQLIETSLLVICALSSLITNCPTIKQFLPLSHLLDLLKSENIKTREVALLLMNNLAFDKPEEYFSSDKEKLASLLIQLLKEKNATSTLHRLYPILLPVLDDDLKGKAFDCLRECLNSSEHDSVVVAKLLNVVIENGINYRPGLDVQIELFHHASKEISLVPLNSFKMLFQQDADTLFEYLSQPSFVLSLSRHFDSAIGKEIIAMAQADDALQDFLGEFVLSGGNETLQLDHSLRLLTFAKDKQILKDLLMAEMRADENLEANLFINYLQMISLLNHDKPMIAHSLPDVILQEGDKHKALYETKKCTDVTLRAFDADGDCLEISCHKSILALENTYFDALFSQTWQKNSSIIEIKDMHLQLFEKAIQFLYLKEYTFASIEEACAALLLAERFSIDGLKKSCLTFFERHLSNDSIEDILNFAEESASQELMKMTLKWLGEYYLFLPEHFQAFVQEKWVLVRAALI